MSQPGKVDHQPAFVLHSVPYMPVRLLSRLISMPTSTVVEMKCGA